MPTVTCTRRGCGKQFDPTDTDAASAPDCCFHPGAPVFHEGLKSWSCCKDVNKPVLDFESFIAIAGCSTGTHSAEKEDGSLADPHKEKKAEEPAPKLTSTTQDGKTEVYGSAPAAPPPSTLPNNLPLSQLRKQAPTSAEVEIEEDVEGAVIPNGTKCKRKGCDVSYEGGDRKEEECVFHYGVPIFHEGSKGYSCCKRRVLEFDEFLKIQGCRKGRHLFVGSGKSSDEVEQVELRTDFYQTPEKVMVSVYGKQADKTKSTVQFTDVELSVDLFLPGPKRFAKTFALFGPIDPIQSEYRILGTKTDVTLAKADGRSWPVLETSEELQKSGFVPQLTFGVNSKR